MINKQIIKTHGICQIRAVEGKEAEKGDWEGGTVLY